MAQHDYVIDNQAFPATRADLNSVLQAIVTNNSGSSAPSTTFANQIWYDSSANILYIRNEDNDANIPLLQLDQSGDVAATLATIIDVLDKSGTNQAGTDLTIRAGAGTGTGAGGNIILQTANAGSSGSSVNSHATAVTVDDAGNVGIGGTPNEYSGFTVVTINGATNGSDLDFERDGTVIASLYTEASGSNDFNIQGTSNLVFQTGGSNDRVTIDSSGNLLVGTTSGPITSGKGTALAPSSLDRTLIVMTSSSVATGVELIQFRNPNGQVGFIGTNASSTTYQTFSDYRMKENVTGITDGIERVKQLNPSRFNFIVDADTTVDGFLAHEVSDIVPEAISGEKDAMKDEEYVATPATGEIYTPAQGATFDEEGNELTAATDKVVHSTDVEEPDTLEEGRKWRETTKAVMATRTVPQYQGIDQSKLVPLLTAAIQEAVAKIEALETRVASLEG